MINSGLLLAVLAVLLFANGCGGDANAITVQTGSLSKAEFIKRAGALCKATWDQMIRQYSAYLEKHGIEDAKGTELVDQVIQPSFERGIDQISALGAPESYAEDATAFLDALQQRLDELQKNPKLTAVPFKDAGKVARAHGLEECADTLGG